MSYAAYLSHAPFLPYVGMDIQLHQSHTHAAFHLCSILRLRPRAHPARQADECQIEVVERACFAWHRPQRVLLDCSG